MSRYDWLRAELRQIPRRKFHVIEPGDLTELAEIEARYGEFPSDYREFVQDFGRASLFRSKCSLGYELMVMVPPRVIPTEPDSDGKQDRTVRLRLGNYFSTGYVWLEWRDGSFRHEGNVLAGLSWQRPRRAGSFEAWLTRSFKAARKLYTREDWAGILQPAPPFTAREQQIVDAIPQVGFRKAGVTDDGKVQVKVVNRSPVALPYLTVGVRSETGMEGSCALPTAGIAPGTARTIDVAMYHGVMDPAGIELFRLPLPDPEDRPYYIELKEGSRAIPS